MDCLWGKRNEIAAIITLCILKAPVIAASCTWPDYFVDTQWEDSSKGHVTFTTNEMTGWSFQVQSGPTLDTWQCHSTDWLETDGYLILITTDVFDPFGIDFYGYLCLKLTRITDRSYRYYQYNPEQSALYNERVYMSSSNTLLDKDSLCLESQTGFRPSESEYKVLIRSGEASSAKVQCPYVFLGQYDYIHTDSTGTISCDTTIDLADGCSDNTQISLNYTTCSTRIAYSVSDTVWCVDSLEHNNNNYVTLYNGNDADSMIDDVTVYRFSCMVISSDRTIASITPNSCKRDQVPSAIPTNVQTNIADGALLQLVILVSCPLLSAPQSGSLTYSTNGAVTTAKYECDAQYSLAGDATRTCQSNMTWSSNPPTCTCILPSPPNNGSVNVTSDGTSLIYTCDAGFVLDGDANRTCQSDSNSWTGSDPTCVPCDSFSAVTGLNWTLAVYGTTTRADFMCETNYTLNGTLDSVCQTDGTWNNALPTCVQCDVIATPDSGTTEFSTDGFFTTVAFGCVPGYNLVGQDRLTCDPLGVWNGSMPVCVCDDPTTPQNGSVIINGSAALHTCDTGFTLVGNSARTCTTDGNSWTGTTPSCVACQTLTDPIGGNVSISTDGFISMATYSCSAGYSLDGDRTSYCQTDGSWNISASNCVTCSTIGVPSSGNVSITSDGVSSQAYYTCARNYTLIGENTSTCDLTGTWSAITPICLCDHVTVPFNGNVIYDSGNTTAYYSCSLGYSLSGSSVRTCEADGSGWSGLERSCETCATLNSVTGGSYSLSTNTVNTMADFTCEVGYTINGTTRLTCQSDGSWDFTQPTCSRCTNLSTPTGENVTMSTTGSVTQAEFTCAAGYTISGTSLLTCNEFGDWDFSAPTCVECPDRQAPLSGFIKMTTDGKVTVATYSCASGYSLIGQTAVTCLPDGNWNLPEPTCDCDSPTTPANGNVLVSGNDVTFSCNVNFTMSGSATGTCQTDGSGWSIQTPTCVFCDVLSNDSGGNLSLVTDGVTTQAVYTCPLGSSLNGTQTVMCNSDGTWSASQPQCVSCPTLSQSVNSGNVDITTNGSVTTATYTCVNGYYVNGANVLICTDIGVWDATVPMCSCDPLSATPGGSVNISDDGMIATFACETGYTINGDVNISCATDGSGWTGAEPSCSKCDNLTNPTGGQISFVSTGTQTLAVYNCSIGSTLSGPTQQPSCQSDGTWNYVNLTCVECSSDVLSLTNGDALQTSDGHRTVITYSCSVGYDLVGANNLTCLSTGLYDNNAPVCYCSAPASPTNGIVTVSADRSVATYSCDSGYILKGVVNRTCRNDSTGWSDSTPTCNSCNSLIAPSGGTYTLTTNGAVTSALFSCSLGYTLNGTAELTCLEDGTWSESPPLCAKCPEVTSPNSGNITLTTDGFITRAQYTCVDGYYLVGADNQTCSPLGYWSDVQPFCACSPLRNPDNGLVNISGDFIVASFSCNLGYTMSGVAIITCGEDRTGWSDSSPTCVTCPNVTAVANGLSQPTTNGTATTIEYTCNAGSSLNGLSTIVCRSDGIWSASESSCVECPSLNKINNGNFTIRTDGKTTTANYDCFYGYSLVGQTPLSCQTDGYWSGFTPYCVCDSPQNISHGQVTLNVNNTLVTYTCDVYYTLSGSQHRSCMLDGTGWNGTEPVCVGCPVLVPPLNGIANITSDGIISRSMFQCDLGTSLQGHSTSICGADGQWNSTVPECVPCSEPVDIDNGNYTLSTNGLNTVVTYLCAPNYILSGNANVTCVSDSSWDVAIPTCVCEDPNIPINGSISSDGITVSYSCDVGYSVEGDRLRSCGNDSSGWRGTDPTCTQCQELSSPQNGSYLITTNGTTSIATFQCNVGTSLNGTDTLICFPDGSWSTTIPYCVTCSPLSQPANGEYSYTTDGITTFVELQCNTGYDVTGTASVTCQSDGTWNFQQTLACEKMTVPTSDKESLLPVLIGVSIAAVLIITLLAILLARFVYLYYRRTNVHVYTPRSFLTESSLKSSKISHSDELTYSEQYKIPSVKLTPAAAPVSYQHHLLDRGPLSSSPAPLQHGKSIVDDSVTSRSPSPIFSGQTSRSMSSESALSLNQLRTNMLPPIRKGHNKPSFVVEDTDTLSMSNSKMPLPKVFTVPKRQLTPAHPPVIPRPSTPLTQPLSIVEPNDTPRENGIGRSQTPVCD